MKIKLIAVLLVMAFASMVPSFVMAQDLGAPDTVIILTNRPDFTANDSTFIVELWTWNDANDIAPQIGFKWESDALTLVGGVASAEATTAFNVHIFYDGDLAGSNANNRAVYAGISFMGLAINQSANRHLIATYTYTIDSWDALSKIFVDSSGWDNGSEMIFVPLVGSPYTPVFWWGERGINVLDPADIGDDNSLPATYSLSQNYPNPFNPATTIDFSLEQAGDYTLTIYNVIGQVVYETTGIGIVGNNTEPWDASAQASGVYFYKLDSGTFSETKKMMLVK